MKMRQFGDKKILPQLPVHLRYRLALMMARIAQADKAYKNGEIARDAGYAELESLDAFSREHMKMPVRELILTCRYFINA